MRRVARVSSRFTIQMRKYSAPLPRSSKGRFTRGAKSVDAAKAGLPGLPGLPAGDAFIFLVLRGSLDHRRWPVGRVTVPAGGLPTRQRRVTETGLVTEIAPVWRPGLGLRARSAIYLLFPELAFGGLSLISRTRLRRFGRVLQLAQVARPAEAAHLRQDPVAALEYVGGRGLHLEG